MTEDRAFVSTDVISATMYLTNEMLAKTLGLITKRGMEPGALIDAVAHGVWFFSEESPRFSLMTLPTPNWCPLVPLWLEGDPVRSHQWTSEGPETQSNSRMPLLCAARPGPRFMSSEGKGQSRVLVCRCLIESVNIVDEGCQLHILSRQAIQVMRCQSYHNRGISIAPFRMVLHLFSLHGNPGHISP